MCLRFHIKIDIFRPKKYIVLYVLDKGPYPFIKFFQKKKKIKKKQSKNKLYYIMRKIIISIKYSYNHKKFVLILKNF
jgi:hypothetical protein